MSSADQPNVVPARAFLRWAGGKSWLVRRLAELFGDLKFQRYHEPFLGGGSFFFAVGSAGEAFLSDRNDALINTYRSVRDECDAVIEHMRGFKNTSEDYYRIRDSNPISHAEQAARFIYLNQTSFNGLYRVNLKGVYNVPYGHRQKQFLDENVLKSAAAALTNTKLVGQDFGDTIDSVTAGDLVFIDPPYTVSHNNNGFIKYNQHLFSLDDQIRLAKYIEQIKAAGASYILTNAAHVKIKEIFDSGDRCLEVSRASLIGGKEAQRGAVSEYIFTNLEAQPA